MNLLIKGKRNKTTAVAIFTAVVVSFAVLGLRSSTEPPIEGFKVKSSDTQAVVDSVDEAIKLNEDETHKVIESKHLEAEFDFNAIAPHWKEKNATETNRKLEIRTSEDKKNWSSWFAVEAVGPLRENEPFPERMFAETPLLIDGRYFQYKITLDRASSQEASPEIYDLKITHIDSRKPKLVVFKEKLQNLFGDNKAYAAQQHPRIYSRSEWGSPDPTGALFKGTDRYWTTAQTPVSQIFIHHTVTASYQSDPSAAVRAIWDFHANTRGWGDVGYNYLMDSQGNVYQGRLGGDNTVGGHVFEYNRGSMGVALLGCFEPSEPTCNEVNGGSTAPPNAVLQDRLTNFLGYKSAGYEIDPVGSHSFCNTDGQNCLNLPNITGHRDANQTSCPGTLTVNSLQNIRNNTVAKKNGGWYYSAKQLSYDLVDFSSYDSINVTLYFKNTGTATWTSTGNKMALYTMEPPGRTSLFQGTSWLSTTKPALLNQASVGPGQTGSFTFNLARPNLPNGLYTEGFTLITDDGNTSGTYFTVQLKIDCTIGQASNPRANGVIIRDTSDGKTYLIENGQKRYIQSVLVAASHGIDLNNAVDVTSTETGLLSNGPAISLREGLLIKASTSPNIYILDDTGSGFVRRLVTSEATMATFGMRFDQVASVSSTTLASYGDGPNLINSSPVPDGRLVKTSTSPTIYLTEAGTKRTVTSIEVFVSYTFSPNNVDTISQQKLTDLPVGTNLYLRSGTLVKISSSPNVYVIDVIGTNRYKRLVTSAEAFEASGFRYEHMKTISTSMLNIYTNDDPVLCHL